MPNAFLKYRFKLAFRNYISNMAQSIFKIDFKIASRDATFADGEYDELVVLHKKILEIQEKKHKHVIRTGAFVGIKYYNKAGNKFRYSKVIKLTLKNIKGFCLSTHWKKRIDPDELFK